MRHFNGIYCSFSFDQQLAVSFLIFLEKCRENLALLQHQQVFLVLDLNINLTLS